ncbi:MAG: hypothetical protein ACRBCL_00345 [Maritimibacter sp.]
MTALTDYDRLEASGLWRPEPDAQRVEVIVSVGEATLTISDTAERILSHWSLPALHRINPGKDPALYAPSNAPDEDETLELSDEDFIGAIEKLRKIIDKRRPRQGRLRTVLTLGIAAILTLGAVTWLPGALVNQTLSVLPAPSRQAVGEALLARIERIAGAPCDSALGRAALDHLGARVANTAPGDVIAVSSGVSAAAHLPGGIILINRALVEDYEEPDVAAGFILMEALRAKTTDPMRALLDYGGLRSTMRLLTTGAVTETVLDGYAETLLLSPPHPLDHDMMIEAFAAAQLRTTPYAYALDPSGEKVLALIEADPIPMSEASPLIMDSDWVSLQGICGE